MSNKNVVKRPPTSKVNSTKVSHSFVKSLKLDIPEVQVVESKQTTTGVTGHSPDTCSIKKQTLFQKSQSFNVKNRLFFQDDDAQSDFSKKVAPHYFKTIFYNVSSRSALPQKKAYKFVDKVAFFEYTKLPGIVCDRFMSLFESDGEDCIQEDAFVKGFLKVFVSSLEEKLKLTFQM